ncbi:MAG: hypothetical protein IJC76_05385 [Lachnospiraceae bacterium]|nr:hypothetical protein [Lachnospiraceae bacterium]
MKEETNFVLRAMSGREKYDEACKATWKLKEIIAPVLQFAVREYQNHSVAEIIGYINASTISDAIPLDDLPAFIEGLEN